MLSAVCIFTSGSLHRCDSTSGTSRATLYRRLILQDLRDDRLASRLLTRTGGMDQGDVEGSRPLHFEPEFDRSVCSHRRTHRSARIIRNYAGRIYETTSLATRRVGKHSGNKVWRA